ncbi:hypothetical protein ACOSP7_003376 [Xanthoceras sorbifolium]
MSKPRTIKLFCPSVSKVVQLVAWEEQRLDLGFISAAFGLDPSTVKINGHFISRGVDLVSTSVTWRSLLKFFSAKGLSTGKHDRDALIVDGKLTKVGSKRSYDCQVVTDINQRPNPEDINLPQNKKLRDSSSGSYFAPGSLYEEVGCNEGDGEELCFLSKLRLNETNSDFRTSRDDRCGTISGTQFKCRYLSKRPREEEVITPTPTPCKRIR